MMQVINIILNVSIFLEIMYIYTCGQDYVKIAVKRARRSFWIDKIIFTTIGVVAIASTLEHQTYSYTQTIFTLMMVIFFGRKCQSIYIYLNRVKN